MTWVGTTLDGKYELVALLGEGGMGAVYEAQHKLIGRRLAVKFLHPQYATNNEVVTRFHREAQAAAQIGHENIIEVTDMGTAADGSPYLVMEYLEGCDVKKLLETEGVPDLKRTAHIMVQALSALQAAHDVGIIHRDLKPENIYLIEKPGRPDYVKLLDFGISKFKDLETDGAKALTQTGTVLGTPHYMSPEQARGEQSLTPKSDVYAMGVILYQMCTGHLPFDAPNYNALLIKILTEDPPLPEVLNPDLPEDLAETIKVAMARDVSARYDDCLEFRNRLLPYAPGASVTNLNLSSSSRTAIRRALYDTKTPFEMSQSGIEEKKSGQKSKLPIIIGGVAAALLAIIAGVVIALSGSEKPAVEKSPPPPVVASQPAPLVEEKEMPRMGEEAVKPPEVNEMTLKINATPAEAKITIDGVAVSNPYEGVFKKSSVNRAIIVSAAGYEKASEMVPFDKDLELVYELEEQDEPVSGKSTKRRPKRTEKPSGGEVDNPKPATTEPDKKPPRRPQRKIDYDDPWG